MQADAIVIGGGLSGLTAAVDLSARGHRVCVLEQRGRFGGRAYSYLDKERGDIVDNGQHLLMGCFRETRRFLDMIGAQGKLTVQKNLEVTFYHPEKGIVVFRCPPLPSPFHIGVGLLRLKVLSMTDRLKLFSVLWEVAFGKDRLLKSDNLTVDEWLTLCNQSEPCKKYFWNVIATATLNDNPKYAAAGLFVKVLREGFLNGRENSVLMIPNTGLSELYVEDARRIIETRGGQLMTNAEVAKVEFSGSEAVGVNLKNGERIPAQVVISSVPLYDLRTIVPDWSTQIPAPSNNLNWIPSSGIATINLWLDRPIMEQEFVSVLDSPIQWIFNKSKVFLNGKKDSSYLSCVISGAGEMLAWEKEQLVRLALDEVGKVYPQASIAELVHSVVVKEKRATLSSSPAMQRYRLPARTSWENFFLAGDWTDTGLPATIESAVKSGFTAAGLAHEYLGRN